MSTHKLCFEQNYEKYQNFLSENFHFLVVKFSVYLNNDLFITLTLLVYLVLLVYLFLLVLFGVFGLKKCGILLRRDDSTPLASPS